MIQSNTQILWRGMKGVCPKCGVGRLLQGYVTPNAACAHCHEDYSQIRADDAPAWLTIFLTGHLLVPLLMYFVKADQISEITKLSILFGALIICMAVILPRAKGLFIAAIWLTRQKKSDETR